MFTPGWRACAYRTASGRAKWLNRDPIGERGEANLYGFVKNDAQNHFDRLGQKCCVLYYPPSPFKSVGHTVLKCDNGAYVSFFAGDSIFGAPGIFQDEEQDKKDYAGTTPQQTCNDCLDEAKVAAWLASAKANPPDYNVCTHNCSDAVSDAAAAGLSDDRQKKPTCPKTCFLDRVFACQWIVDDILNPSCPGVGGAGPGPSASKAQTIFKRLADNNCNRYKCVKCCVNSN